MSFLVKTIDRGKWGKNLPAEIDQVPSDAITHSSCKTSDNKLSLWEERGDMEADNAVLAIAAGLQHLESKDFVFLPYALVQEAGLHMEHTPGITPVHDQVRAHHDLTGLTLGSLRTFHDLILTSLQQEMVIRYTALRIKKILIKAIGDNRLRKEDLKESVRAKI